MSTRGFDINVNSNLYGESDRRASANRSIGGLLKLAKRSCDTEVLESSHQNVRRANSLVPRRSSISQKEVHLILDTPDQWAKLQQTIRDRRYTTGMKLKQELHSLLQERLQDIPTTDCSADADKKKAHLMPNLHQRVVKRLSTLQNEAAVPSRYALRQPSMMMLSDERAMDLTMNDSPYLDQIQLLQILDSATNLSEELCSDDFADFDREGLTKSLVIPRMA